MGISLAHAVLSNLFWDRTPDFVEWIFKQGIYFFYNVKSSISSNLKCEVSQVEGGMSF